MAPHESKKKLRALDPTLDPQKPGPPSGPRDSRTPPPSTLPESPPAKDSVPSAGYDSTREPGRRDEL
jgi:hypothetical protein